MISSDAYTYVHNPKALTPATQEAASVPVENLRGWQVAIDEIHTWPEYSPQPLHHLAKTAQSLGLADIRYKDESQRFGRELGSFKALGAPYTVYTLLADHVEKLTGTRPTSSDLRSGRHKELTKRVTVCVATDGNQGRGLAYGAKIFGCRCVDYIHDHVSPGRKDAMEELGAVVIRVDGEYEASVHRAKEDARMNGWYFVSSTSWDDYQSPLPRHVMSAYMVMVEETLVSLPDVSNVTHVFMQGGVGSIAAAVFLGFTLRLQSLGVDKLPRFVMIEPEEADCLLQSAKHSAPKPSAGTLRTIAAGLACREVSPAAWKILEWLVVDFLSIPDSWVVEGMKSLADGHGDIPVVCGESSAGAMGVLIKAAQDEGLRAKLGLGAESQVVIYGCEGATDGKLYKELVGENAEDVFARQETYISSQKVDG